MATGSSGAADGDGGVPVGDTAAVSEGFGAGDPLATGVEAGASLAGASLAGSSLDGGSDAGGALEPVGVGEEIGLGTGVPATPLGEERGRPRLAVGPTLAVGELAVGDTDGAAWVGVGPGTGLGRGTTRICPPDGPRTTTTRRSLAGERTTARGSPSRARAISRGAVIGGQSRPLVPGQT
jgi:hypothetical protein